MTAVTMLREGLVRLLKEGGLSAMEAFSSAERRRWEKPVLVVSVKEFAAKEPGLGSYLGERWKAETQSFEEVYGQWVSIRFSLDLYGPKSGGDAGFAETIDRVCELLSGKAPMGLSVLELNFGETKYDQSCDLLRRQGSLACEGLLYALQAEDGSFNDFEVRGGITRA